VNRRRPTAQQGFTLIELIGGIVVVGVLSASALSQVADVSGQARAVKLRSAAAAIAHVSTVVHGKTLIAPATATVAFEEIGVDVLHGYPRADIALLNAAGINSAMFQQVLPAQGVSPTLQTRAGQVALVPIQAEGIQAGDTCHLIYTQATASAAASIEVNTSRC
jgi:prepilin-type N-terminal cleavage/methylation domain-containing protein